MPKILTLAFKKISIICFFFFTLSSSCLCNPEEKEDLLNGWYSWDPYQYIRNDESIGNELTGLDVELTKTITELAGKKVHYQPVEWKQHQQDLKDGKRDFASGATKTAEREKYFYFSEPYRFEENSLFVRRGEEAQFPITNSKEFLELASSHHLKIGIIDGYVYADPAINDWLQDPKNQEFIIRVTEDKKNIILLLDNKIDAFLADRISGATEIWRGRNGENINEIRLGAKTPIHFMFSKKNVSYSTVEKFNFAIEKAKNTNQYQNIISWYLHPVLLLQTIDTNWFRLLEIIGTIAFAISGLVIAVRDRSTIFGAFIFAVLPSIGGGIIRDLIFDRKPVGALQSPRFLYVVISTVIIGFFAIRIASYINRRYNLQFVRSEGSKVAHTVLMLCDGMGLAAFTITGIVVSVMAKATPLWLWGAFFAFLTGAGGGILRDALSKQRDIISLRGDIYPEIAVLWGFILSVFLMSQTLTINPDAIRNMVLFTAIGAFLTRVIVYTFKVPNIHFSTNGPDKP